MASSELSGPFHLGFEQRQPTIEFLVIFFAIRNRCDKISSLSETLSSLRIMLVSPLAFSSGYENLWDLPDVEAVDWSDMGLSIPVCPPFFILFWHVRNEWRSVTARTFV